MGLTAKGGTLTVKGGSSPQLTPPQPNSVTHITTVAGPSTDRTGAAPAPTQQTITRPSQAYQGNYVIVEFGMSVLNADGSGTGLQRVITAPSGWSLITSGWKSGTPSVQYAAYGKFMAAGEPSSWVFSWDGVANVVSQIRVFSGVNTSNPVPEKGWLAQAASNTSRITPSITTAANRFVIYSTHDRNGSNPAAPSPDTATKVSTLQSSSASLATARAGALAAGTYSRTFTGAASTSVAGSSIMALANRV